MNSLEMNHFLNALCPLHVVVDPTGHIASLGATMGLLRDPADMVGARFLEVFQLLRPRGIETMGDLVNSAGSTLQLRFRAPPATSFKAILATLPDRSGAVVNFSFGISIVDAVREYHLTSKDFAPTDLAVEMLYLAEAKSTALDASRKLNSRLEGAKIAAQEQAFTDTLTGVKNRRALEHVLARQIMSGRPFALMHMDLDRFKQVNDTFGHAAGDFVLQQVARVMVEEIRREDTVARVGGDEFVLIFDGLREDRDLEDLSERLIRRLSRPILFEGNRCEISASLGTTLSENYPQPIAAQMLADADQALYISKNNGRGCYSFFKQNGTKKMMDTENST